MATRTSRAYTSPWPSQDIPPFAVKKRLSVIDISEIPHTRQPTADQPPRKPRSRRPSTSSAADPRKPSSDTQSIISRTSSLGLLMRTGPVEEVAPWELYPVPASPITTDIFFKASTSTPNLKNRKSSSSSTPTAHFSPSSAPRTMSTGPVEEVTPWELSPGPSHSDFKPDSPVILKQSFASPVSPPSRSLPNLEHESVPVFPRSKPTGPTEDVTPWELTPAPAEGQEFDILADIATMPSLSKTMAQLEEVTPWELYPAPRPSGSNVSATVCQMLIGSRRILYVNHPLSENGLVLRVQAVTNSAVNSIFICPSLLLLHIKLTTVYYYYFPLPFSSMDFFRKQSRPSNKTLSEPGRPRKSNGSKSAKTTRSSIPATGISNIPHEAAFVGQQKVCVFKLVGHNEPSVPAFNKRAARPKIFSHAFLHLTGAI